MVVANGSHGNGTKLLILGLSRKNVEELQKGRPIFKTAEEIHEDHNLIIMFGETEEDIQQEIGREFGRLPGDL